MTIKCNSCGAPFSDRYGEVRGDNNDEIHKCRYCEDGTADGKSHKK